MRTASSKSPTTRNQKVNAGISVDYEKMSNGPSGISPRRDSFETSSRLSKNSKRISTIKGVANTSQGGWNKHSAKVVSAEEEEMKLMAQERRKAYDEETRRRNQG